MNLSKREAKQRVKLVQMHHLKKDEQRLLDKVVDDGKYVRFSRNELLMEAFLLGVAARRGIISVRDAVGQFKSVERVGTVDAVVCVMDEETGAGRRKA